MAVDARTYVQLLMQEGDLPDLATLIQRPDWTKDAFCKEHPEVCFFPGRGESSAEAKAICAQCSVRQDCLDYAMGFNVGSGMPLQGVWAGFTVRERRLLRSKRPDEHLTLEQALQLIPVASVPIRRQAKPPPRRREPPTPPRQLTPSRRREVSAEDAATALPSCEGCGLPISRLRLSGRCRSCEDEVATA